MVDPLEKKLGDLLKDLESRRDELRRELDNVSAQLDLISGLIGTPVRDRRPPQKTIAASSTVAKPPSRSGKAKKRGRPHKPVAKAKSPAASKKTTHSGKTLKEELFAIAKSSGGNLRVREASEQLVKSGRYTTTDQASANIYAAIQYYKNNFIRDASTRGVYRVKA